MSLEHTLNRIENVNIRIDKFIDENIVEWSEEIILAPTRKKTIQFGLSQRASDAISIKKTGFMKTSMIWDFRGPNDEPLHLFLEKGFGKGGYTIQSKGLNNKNFLRFKDKSGKFVFRKKVHHPGFLGYKILETSWKENKPQLARFVSEHVTNFMEVNRL